MEITMGQPKKIGYGVMLLRMPLPFRLDHINLYLLDDGDSWTLIDTGLNSDNVKTIWDNLLKTFFKKKSIGKIVLTHLHPDHIGLAAWLSERCGAPVHISKGDWSMACALWDADTDQAAQQYRQYYSRFGVCGDVLEELVKHRAGYKKLVKQLPCHVHFLIPGEKLQSDGKWEILEGKGHSPQHICLWNEGEKVMISGDHILPTITPNVSLMVHGLRNPLQSYLRSLKQFGALHCQHYLPAHGLPSDNYQARIGELLAHHQQQLTSLLKCCDQPMTVAQALPILFKRELPIQQRIFALGEAAAHLVYLTSQEQLSCTGSQTWVFTSNEIVLEKSAG